MPLPHSDGLTYSGPQDEITLFGRKHMAFTVEGEYYLGPIKDPNFVDALGFGHDLNKGYMLQRPGFKNLIITKIGNSVDWRFC